VLPPRRLLRDGRPLKVWRYAGLYTPELMLCAGRVAIGGVPQRFWAVWDRERGELHEHTRTGGGLVRLDDDRVRVADRSRAVEVDVRLQPFGDPIEVCSPHGSSHIWTRKWLAQGTGEVRIAGRAIAIDAPLLIDDSAGYHARNTDWEWSAGFGEATDGGAVAWNLVTGINDAVHDSERTVWIDGKAAEVGPVTFSADLAAVMSAQGERLEFAGEATRERHDRVGPVRSDYVQPFGTFSGTLPGGVDLIAGYGVMERHAARW
jgi:hypothetical protein